MSILYKINGLAFTLFSPRGVPSFWWWIGLYLYFISQQVTKTDTIWPESLARRVAHLHVSNLCKILHPHAQAQGRRGYYNASNQKPWAIFFLNKYLLFNLVSMQMPSLSTPVTSFNENTKKKKTTTYTNGIHNPNLPASIFMYCFEAK